MTASKSSRARNARAQRARANAARNGGAAGRATGNSTAVKAAARVEPAAPVKAAARVEPDTVVQARSQPRAAAARGGAPDRRGSRGPTLTQEITAEVPGTTTAPLWFQLVTFGLALAGLGVSIYLTIAHFTESALLGCSETGGLVNCTKVTTSPQSYAFGIPVAVLGLAFYVVAVALMSPWAWRAARYRREIYLVRVASLVVGIGFVLYLLYAELFIIGSICLYCTSVHVITFVLFGFVAFAAAAWGIPARQRATE